MVVVLSRSRHAVRWRRVGSSITAASTSHTFSVGLAAAVHSVQVCPATQQCVLGAVVLWRSSAAAQLRSLPPPPPNLPPQPPLIQSHTVVRSLWNAVEVSLRCLHSEKYKKRSYRFIERRLPKVCVCTQRQGLRHLFIFFRKKNGKTPTRRYLCLVATKICEKLGYKSSRLQLKVKKEREKKKQPRACKFFPLAPPLFIPTDQGAGRRLLRKKKKKSTNRD